MCAAYEGNCFRDSSNTWVQIIWTVTLLTLFSWHHVIWICCIMFQCFIWLSYFIVIRTATNLLQNLSPLFPTCFRWERGESHVFPVHSFHSSGIWVYSVFYLDAAFHCSKKLQELFTGPIYSQVKNRKQSTTGIKGIPSCYFCNCVVL